MTDTKFGCTDEYLADTFPKMNNMQLSFQGKQLTTFTVSDKIQVFNQILEFRTIKFTTEFDSFLTVNDLSVEIEGNVNKCDFFISYNEMSKHL